MTALVLSGCTAPVGQVGKGDGVVTRDSRASGTACPVPQGKALPPSSGVLAGVNLDWGSESLEDYAARLGRRPAVAVSFAPFPLSALDEENVAAAKDQVRANGGLLLLTLEPYDGLEAVTQDVADELATLLDGYNRDGVPVVVRFAHEMNGSWYPWGQQPEAYRGAFRRVADAVHRLAPGSATMWAPNYGGGYPFAGGKYAVSAGSAEHRAMDSNHDTVVDARDDSYAPYYPGDDAVDWVGMTIYHWGGSYPWGANVVPEAGKLLAQLTGRYDGAGGDDTAVPDFYTEYGVDRGKPVAIPETAALYVPGGPGAGELEIKRAWWRQLADPVVRTDYPQVKMINWFEWRKHEAEVDGTIDWRATGRPAMNRAYVDDLPAWFHYAGGPAACPALAD